MPDTKRFIRSAPHPGEVWKAVVMTMLAKEPFPSNKDIFAKANAITQQYRELWWPTQWDEKTLTEKKPVAE